MFGTFLTWLSDHKSQVFVVATSNNIKSVPPEFFRAGRFDGIFFVDIPSLEEQCKILEIYTKRYGVPVGSLPECLAVIANWTGAEIETLCRHASIMGSMEEAARYIVPIYRSRGREINELREYARGNCVPASIPQTQVKSQTTRRIRPSASLEN